MKKIIEHFTLSIVNNTLLPEYCMITQATFILRYPHSDETAVGFIRYGRRRRDRIGTARFGVVSRISTELIFFAYTEFFMLGATCTNSVDWFPSAAEILACENRG